MANNKNNATTEAVVALNTAYEQAVADQKAVADDATDEVKAEAQKKVDDALSLLDAELLKAPAADPKPKGKLVKGVFIVSPTGRYNLAYNVGEKASLPELQALELEEAGYFRIGK
ncbi:hypothetical protein [Flavobacterium algicola]|uniref:hypothetical protein n=1 Tax=Flavobacterium algicola TaxID=556529 RepID=UPI001EFEA432|nr:hypothetical protein [Flavobacterium algicola]MCG9792488.1 hypothetical protein [Flavobacterium algicola]